MKAKFAVVVLAGLAAALFAAAQEKGDVFYRTAGPAGMDIGEKESRTPVMGAPYSATMTNESVQVLADGNRITEHSSGMRARDSQGRTRQDASLPLIGNMTAEYAPQFVFINDPVSQKSYTLNLTAKTAKSYSMPGPGNGDLAAMKMKLDAESRAIPGPGQEVFVQRQVTTTDAQQMKLEAEQGAEARGQVSMEYFGPQTIGAQKMTLDAQKVATENAQVNREDLGTQTMEGVVVTGVRTTRTIPAGQIGNEQPINIVTEVWTSPELKTVVMSKRSDPRMGEQTFRLTNIARSEPDPSLFAVPADFRIVEGPQPVINYRPNR